VTPKAGVMLKIQLCHYINKLDLKIYLQYKKVILCMYVIM